VKEEKYLIDPRPRPSSLPHLAACPRWVARPEDPGRDDGFDSAAREGTLNHSKMEELALVPTDGWAASIESDPDLGPALAPLVSESADQVRDLFSLSLPVVTKASLGLPPDGHYELADVAAGKDGIYCEAGVSSGIARPGTADLVAVTGSHATLVDYKNTFVARDHRAQMLAYVAGVFAALPRVNLVSVRIVTPRLGNAHEPEVFARDGLGGLYAELTRIVADAADPFKPGCPGDQCAMCAGNARCSYQAATLRDIPVDLPALVNPGVWVSLIDPPTLEMRGQRKRLAKWMEPFCEAVKKDDQEWALANPDAEIPGFVKTVAAGRPSLDKTRLAELNESLRLRFGLTREVMDAFSVPDSGLLAEYVALGQGMTVKDAETEIKRCFAPFQERGKPVVRYRAEKPGAKELKELKELKG
jgi:hypothetical protein